MELWSGGSDIVLVTKKFLVRAHRLDISVEMILRLNTEIYYISLQNKCAIFSHALFNENYYAAFYCIKSKERSSSQGMYQSENKYTVMTPK